MGKAISIYLDEDIVDTIKNSLVDKESFSNKVNSLLRLGLQKQEKMIDMPMGKVIKLLNTIYENKYKQLDK